VVDVLRQCYTADVRFFNDSEELRKIVWYFVPDDRQAMPWEHAFGSRIYDREEELEPAIGERFEPVPWRGGQAPCPETGGGLCGTEAQWQFGASVDDPLPEVHPGTNVGKCCEISLLCCDGGLAIGRLGFGACHMESTCDIYSPFGAASPSATNVPVQFVQDLFAGRGTSPCNTVAWTHYIDVAEAVTILDGCTRTATLNTIDYLDGDEVRIPTGGSSRYVVVWVTLCDEEGTTVKRAYLMRHAV